MSTTSCSVLGYRIYDDGLHTAFGLYDEYTFGGLKNLSKFFDKILILSSTWFFTLELTLWRK